MRRSPGATWPAPCGRLAALSALAACLWAGACAPAQPIQVVAPPTSRATATPASTITPVPTATSAPLRVDMAGAVLRPGVYTLPPGSIVADAIAAAGGAAEGADLDRLNKAAPLANGVQVYVPYAGAPPRLAPLVPPPSPASPTVPAAQRAAPPLPGTVDLNTASLAELEALPEIGATLGQRIIDGRPYAAIEDARRVTGIGETTFVRIKPFITVGP